MVERAVCSNEEETNSGSKIASCNVDREAGAHEVTGRLETHRKSHDPEVFKVIESLKQERKESPIPGPAGRFSLFKWFKRGSRDSSSSWENREREKNSDRAKSNRESSDLEENEITSELSSNESVETLYSTATVRSFAFQSGTIGKKDPKDSGRHFGEPFSYDFPNTTTRSVGPFGVGASKITTKPELNRFDVTKTLPANVLSNRRDITARYSLQSCNGSSSGFGSCGHFGSPRDCLLDKRNFLNDRGSGRVHVRGKRRAPNPPIEVTRTKKNEETIKNPKNRTRGKRRPAPKPPEVNLAKLRISDNSAITNKTIDPNSPVKEETETPKNSSASAVLTVNKETESVSPNQTSRSSNKRVEKKIESVPSPEVKEFEISTRTRFEEIPTGSKVPETLEKEELQVSKSKNIELSEISLKNSSKTINNVAEKKLTSSEAEFQNKVVKVEQSDNSPRTKDDVTNLLRDIQNSEVPEGEKKSFDLAGSISNDSLVLQGGVLLSKRDINASFTCGTSSNASDVKVNISRSKGRISVTTGSQTSMSAMPRPWYKRSVFEHSRDSGTSRRNDFLRNSNQPEAREEGAENTSISGNSAAKLRHIEKNQDGGTLSRLNFFHRSEKSTEERKKETKRKSGVSMLANISELDKEAAAIVQEEQARTRAASMLLQASKSNDEKIRNETEDIVQEMVTSVMESSPKRGTRALISKFNAIGNITKVTVNTSFFAKQPYARDSKIEKNEFMKNPRDNEWREKTRFEKSANVRTDKDLSRYFLPAQKIVKNKKMEETSEKSSEILMSNDISTRLSFFQNVSAGEKKAHPENCEISIEAKIDRLNEQVLSRRENNRDFENSPKFSRLRINGLNEESVKFNQQEINEENGGKVNCEVRKDFSDIFREIGNENRGKIPEKQQGNSAASQVSKVLDILVEAEKNDRRRTSATSIAKNSEEQKKETKAKILDAENPIKTDLREMLKEMKHSLPKRPKPNKTRDQQTAPKPEEKAEEKKKFISMNDKKKEFFLSSTEKSALLSPVTVVYPPPIRNAPIFAEPTKPICRENEDREYDRQKVSSAAQTCGNLRKKISPTKIESPKNPKKDVSPYRPGGSGISGTSGVTKNTFQLIRPREFAQIEAIKTMKNGGSENTYANVIEQSLYANALVPPRKESDPIVSRNGETSRRFSEEKLSETRREINETETIGSQDLRAVESQNMNTLAVNRLLRKLEAAIASGHHQQAAGLAKELARLKIHCSVVRQRPKTKDIINVNMYIEDKLAHQGPIPLRLTRSMTVAQLKAKVFTEFEIPTHVQRWIVGKNLADDDSTKLEDLQAVDGSPVFLYLVAPETKNDETGAQDETVKLAEKNSPKDELLQTEEVTKLMEIEESAKVLSECQTIKEEEDEECISEEVRMERYEALISLENCDVIPNSEPIECPICFVTYGPQEGVILRDCLHMFCRPCIANTIRYCEEAEVKCPFRDTEYTCESTLQEREIKSLVEPEVYQQHLAKSITQAENNAGNNAFHCKTPDCPGWCIYDDNVNNFLCPVCGVNNCLTCQVVHTGKNCRQYQEELRLSKETDHESKRTAAMLEEMVDRGEALPCPTCAVVLMKKWGCDWLRCSMCKTEICWVTRGPRWGPGGKGDTSGGCRCGEKGVKCHPRCNYCH